MKWITHTTLYICIPICQVILASGIHCCPLNTTEVGIDLQKKKRYLVFEIGYSK